MKRVLKYSLYLPALATLVSLLSGCDTKLAGILNPKGIIAFQERQLLSDSTILMLIVVIPVIVMSIAFVWRYHQSKDSSEYLPNWCHDNMFEAIWWGVPIAIILMLAIMTWETTHKLDPYNKIDVEGKVLPIQVVALPWKWLFIYPEQNIATVNFLEIPRGRQIEFFLTTDNVAMSSFFIPQLGSQIYTMAGMRTRLHLVATHMGTFQGLNSQYNGEGFSGMKFDTRVVDAVTFKAWAKGVALSSSDLTSEAYQSLRKPTIASPIITYKNVQPGLFQTIMKSYKAAQHPA